MTDDGQDGESFDLTPDEEAQFSGDVEMSPAEKQLLAEMEESAQTSARELQVLANLQSAIEQLTQAIQQMNRPKRIVRGPDGRAQGIMTDG